MKQKEEEEEAKKGVCLYYEQEFFFSFVRLSSKERILCSAHIHILMVKVSRER